MTAKIDAAGAFALLERVVAERGEDFVYRSQDDSIMAPCTYVHGADATARPGCAVGLAATYAGVNLATLAEWDKTVPTVVQYVAHRVFDRGGLLVLAAFHDAQDSRARPYSVALACAREAFDRQQAA